MAKPFYERLRKYYSDVATVLRGQGDAASIFPNPTDIGTARERWYAEFLRLHLPANCSVFFGGFVFDADGNESKQLDVLVTSDRVLQFNFHNKSGDGKSFAAVDGCVGAVSLKSTLTTAELHDALLNLASIPEQTPLAKQGEPRVIIWGYEDWPFKVIFALDGISAETCQDGLETFYTAHPEIPDHRRVNLIHVAGKYGIIRARRPVRWTDDTVMPKGTFGTFTTDCDVRGLLIATLEIQFRAQAAGHIGFRFDYLMDKLGL